VKNIITISGKSGCGNSTISKLIAEKFGYEHINLTLRQIAEEQGITFEIYLMKPKVIHALIMSLINVRKP
jgi:cytidylate kinase